MANTKITLSENHERKSMKLAAQEMGGRVYSDKDTGVTIVAVPAYKGANTMDVAVSVMSRKEQKFRRKVGEYHALCRWISGHTIPAYNLVEECRDSNDEFEDWARQFADLIG